MNLIHHSSDAYTHLPQSAGHNPLKNSNLASTEPMMSPSLKAASASLSLTHFSFAVDVARNVVVHYDQVPEQLGYSPEELNPSFLQFGYHPSERATLQNLTVQIEKCLRHYPTAPPYYTFIIGHRLKKSNGDYLKVLNYVQPILFEPNNNLLVLNNLCVDVSAHRFETVLTFDVHMPPHALYSRSEIVHFFQEIFTKDLPPFTERELLVLATWVSLNSTKAAADQLDITERTLETHLKNIRKKANMNRTMDVVLLAKAKGWI